MENTIDFPAIVKEQKRAVKRNRKEATANAVAQANKRFKIKFYSILFVVTAMAISIYWFADNYQLRNPVLLGFQAPYIKRDKSIQLISPIVEGKEVVAKSDMETIEQYKLSVVLKGMYILESSRGKNDGCKDQNQFNGYGFRQNSSEYKCYPNFEQVTQRVNEWLEERLAFNGNDLSEALCYYNTGHANNAGCEYSHKFMRVLVDIL